MILEILQVTTSQIGKRGFTLTELLVVVVIIIIIAASVLTVVPGLSERANTKATRAFIDRLEIAIEEYYNDNRTYPSSGIASLMTTLEPSGTATKRYIEFKDYELDSDGYVMDSFGNPFVYAYPGTQTTFAYDLYSTGPDGVTASFGTDTDDINNWSR
jgi:type II secretion system protein G